jgi:hypothetical protein
VYNKPLGSKRKLKEEINPPSTNGRRIADKGTDSKGFDTSQHKVTPSLAKEQ